MNNEKKFIKLTPFKMQVLQTFPFIDEDFDAITNYELLCKVVDYLNKTVNNVDLLNEKVEEFQNYFDNLDVQEEINNKLDDMAESGQLADIIAQYLGLAGMLVFNNVNDMKQATNLVNGSICSTLGYNSINDGGKSTYKIRNITNEDIVDEMFIIALQNENLIAELIIDNKLLLSQVGANISSSSLANTQIINKSLQYINNHKNTTLIIDNSYTFDSIDLTNISNISIKGTNETKRILINNSIIVPTNLNNFENLCFELQTNATLLNVSGTYNTFTNCKFYGKNNHTGIGANISNYVNTFTNCSFREFAKCIIANNNQINFINCVIIGNDSPTENEDTITINGGMNINFTNCDIEKGYHIITINDGLINFNGCYIEGATSRYHILLNDGITTIENNYLNNIRVGKYSVAKLSFINNTINKTVADDYTVFPLEQNIGYLVIINNKFVSTNGYMINIDNINNTTVTQPCPRYYDDLTSSWKAGTRNDYLCIIQERCFGFGGIGLKTAQLLPIHKPKSSASHSISSYPILANLGRGDTLYDTTLNKLLVKLDNGWVDYDGQSVS